MPPSLSVEQRHAITSEGTPLPLVDQQTGLSYLLLSVHLSEMQDDRVRLSAATRSLGVSTPDRGRFFGRQGVTDQPVTYKILTSVGFLAKCRRTLLVSPMDRLRNTPSLRSVDPNDRELIDGAKRGNSEACTRLVERYDRPLKSVIDRFVSHCDDVDEIAQDTW